jgi:hypothetical protein
MQSSGDVPSLPHASLRKVQGFYINFNQHLTLIQHQYFLLPAIQCRGWETGDNACALRVHNAVKYVKKVRAEKSVATATCGQLTNFVANMVVQKYFPSTATVKLSTKRNTAFHVTSETFTDPL